MSPKKKTPSVATMEPLRVDIVEAARILGVSRSRVYLRIKEGSLRAVKEGGRTLLAISELHAYVARTNAAAAASASNA